MGYLQTSPMTLVGVIEQNGAHHPVLESLPFPQWGHISSPNGSDGTDVFSCSDKQLRHFPPQMQMQKVRHRWMWWIETQPKRKLTELDGDCNIALIRLTVKDYFTFLFFFSEHGNFSTNWSN
jgi:hypothetical protein